MWIRQSCRTFPKGQTLGILNVWKPFPVILALSAPTSLAATETDCLVTSAILSDDKAQLSGIAIGYNSDGTLDIAYEGKPDIFRGASECFLRTPKTFFELNCQWEYNSDEEGARAKLEALRTQLNMCLPTQLEDEGTRKGYGSLEVPQQFRLRIPASSEDGEDTSVRLWLYLYTGYTPARYSVNISFDR